MGIRINVDENDNFVDFFYLDKDAVATVSSTACGRKITTIIYRNVVIGWLLTHGSSTKCYFNPDKVTVIRRSA